MKLVIEPGRLKKPDLENPIKLENLRCFKNRHGQWCVEFSSVNHKYLCVNYNTSTNCVNEERCEYGMAQGITIETGETFKNDESEFDWPEDSLIIWLVPESEQESDEISGVDAVLPSKWAYSICIVPFEDFYDQN